MSDSKDQVAYFERRSAEKREELKASIPEEYLLPQALLDELHYPLEDNRNELQKLNIPCRSGIFSTHELDIIDHNVPTLLRKLATGNLTALEVTIAFCKAASVAQQLTGCLTEIAFDQAQSRARELDKLRQRGQLAGPLHGLPISLKDTFHITGTQSTIGLWCYIDNEPSNTNSPLVDVLLKEGAVPFAKTSVPQLMMTTDSQNNIFGRVLNAVNTILSAGGSSGGEGALVGFRGSPLGVGTDIAGSIRIPAAWNRCYGFKPTGSRIPYGGQQLITDPGFKIIPPCAGPIANDFEALEIFCRAVIDAKPSRLDATAYNVPWRTLPQNRYRKLRIGLIPEDPIFPLHPSIKRIMETAVQRIEAQGHTIVRLRPEECAVAHASEIIWSFAAIDDEPMQKIALEPTIQSRNVMAQSIMSFKKSLLPDLSNKSQLKKYSFLNMRMDEYRDAWQKVWIKHELDVGISPMAQGGTPGHDEAGSPAYTGIFNVLDYPACNIPFGEVENKNEEDFRLAPGQVGPPYKPSVHYGAPCSIQVFAKTLEDEECLNAARIVDECLKL